ncbi:ABC transporter permease [Mucilaginibacter sabulilitoris]|uniref:ABC transporter permease n=1 Tax=Mucilaginibacter sabulilitoris TaxID=1173583 RepID=A0ABZ0TD02_9SPHI|nr:ABC transporter permease [Mucilaginibacter sabulilitoris]WPU91091.1 ABC transporter permease [Mucilaginibacter sabulilitoris]
MIGNYFKTTVRSLLNNRAYSFLNIAGLAIGIACASLIFLWVQDEFTYNHNFEKRNNLYTIYENQTYEGKKSTFHATPGPMAAALKTEIPGIKNTARIAGKDNLLFSLGEKAIREEGSYTDPEIFSMLKLSFVQGDESNVFRELHSVVINITMARKFFGDANPVGKTLKMNNEQEFTVTGVFNDLPKNSTFQFQWLAPIKNIDHKAPWMNDWSANWAHTYVELEPSADVNAVNQKLLHYIKTKKNKNTTECFLFSMNDWNLHDSFTDGKMDGGRIEYVCLFAAIAFIILIIACINFMNLSTARSEKRAKEVGVRKVMGAGKGKLIGQFIGEAVIMAYIAVFMAIGIVYIAMPFFNNLVQKELAINIMEPGHLIYLIAIGLVTGLLAGSYPAFYLSSFNPITVLKSMKLPSGAGAGFIRQSLVVIQFSVSIILIIGTVIIYQQIQHVKTRDLGYNKNNLIYVSTQGKLIDHFESVYNDLKASGVVEDASLSDSRVLEVGTNTDNYSWDGKDPSKNPLISWENVNAQFIKTMGIKLAAGRGFYANASLDSNNVIINQDLARQMGKQGHIGGIIRNGEKSFQIVGIVKDFLYNDMYAGGGPLLLYNHPTGTSVLSIRFKDQANIQDALSKIGTIITTNNPGYPFEYKFMDDDFDQLFKTETLTGKLAGTFASLAIIISCLGLFGLAAYTAERRIKEIGIRKVLGASVTGLTGLLSKDFLKLVAISCLIAFPVAWWALTNWLQNYQYRVNVNWVVFAAVGVLAMLIALVTVSFQAIKAALSNPVKNLRTE